MNRARRVKICVYAVKIEITTKIIQNSKVILILLILFI